MFKFFNNVGIIEKTLSKDVIKKLKTCIKTTEKRKNSTQVANNSNSFLITDKEDWFFNTVLSPTIKEYTDQYTLSATVPAVIVEKEVPYILNRFWVNYQKKYEFNPVHNHTGVFSFVVWLKIPSSYKKECELPFIKHAILKRPNTFQMLFVNSLGDISQLDYNLEPEDEGNMLLFSSKYHHCVYPFYLSDKERISVSGNIGLKLKKDKDV